MVSRTDKARGAFRTIGEVSAETGLAHHILRYWETRFPQLRPVTRAGNRRYYRPEDVALVRRTPAGFCAIAILEARTRDYVEARVRALESLLTEKGYVDPAALDAQEAFGRCGHDREVLGAQQRGVPVRDDLEVVVDDEGGVDEQVDDHHEHRRRQA